MALSKSGSGPVMEKRVMIENENAARKDGVANVVEPRGIEPLASWLPARKE